MKNQYKILMHGATYQSAVDYLKALVAGTVSAGAYLKCSLKSQTIDSMLIIEFLEKLIGTKKPQIFAESAIYGGHLDWNQPELSILGDIAIVVPVTVYDDGRHHRPRVHQNPFQATLLYTPGALLRNDRGGIPADWEAVVSNEKINYPAFYSLYERRLLPSFMYANQIAKSNNAHALITMPGLGCGQFAGKFRGQLGGILKDVLTDLLIKHREKFSNIKAVYYDPYQECDNERLELDGLSFMVRPHGKGNENKSQLCEPKDYEEENDHFEDCQLFSIVAWDHVSWPGNDFYVGSRSTDDGVKAAATSSMAVMTSVEGRYNISSNTYDPPLGYSDWQNVINRNGISIVVQDNILLYE